MKRYTREKYLEMIPQRGVKQCFIDAPGFNATWDYKISPDGHHYFPLCAEGTFPEYVKLYEYLPESNEVKLCFDLEDSIVVYPRTIRPSKIHTSINFMPDGRMIMTTHTTASAPSHPCWMPEAYYTHLWEGFHGSNVLIYDPKTGKVEDLGIPVPRDTIYGAVYIHETRSLYFTTYFRGHAYRFDLDTRTVTDFGQCTEFGTYYLFRATDGNIYFSTRSGELWRFNIQTQAPEFTGICIPRDDNPSNRSRNVFAYADNGPDGRMYFVTHVGTHIFAYDPKTNTLETVGDAAPEGIREDYPTAMVFGLAFDREGKLWYTISAPGSRIIRWDILKPGTVPEDFGMAGTPGRCHNCMENAFIRDDVLYMSDTNHAMDPPGILAVDLQTLREDRDQPRLRCQDPVFFQKEGAAFDAEHFDGDIQKAIQPYIDYYAQETRDAKNQKANPHTFGRKKKYICKLWKTVGIPRSQVCAVEYDADGNAVAYLDKDGGLEVTTHDGEILRTEPAAVPAASMPAIPEGLVLPAHPGRQYLAEASAAVTMGDGSLLIATKDGMLARYAGGRLFKLGAVCNDGPIRAMAVSPDGKTAYGVGGDTESLGVVFSFDLEEGVELLGHIYFENGDSRERTSVSCEPCCIAFSPDGSRVAIGVRDNLGCLYEFEV